MSSVTITIDVLITSGNSSAPYSATLKFLMMDIDTSVNNVG